MADAALYRATCLQTEVLLRSYQLYATVPERTWLKLHTQYQLACQLGAAADEIAAQVVQRGAANSIHGCYIHALLLGCIKANQLRQEDLTVVHKLLPEWSNFAIPKGFTDLINTATAGGQQTFHCDFRRGLQPAVVCNDKAGDMRVGDAVLMATYSNSDST